MQDRIGRHLVGAGRDRVLHRGRKVRDYGTGMPDVEYSYIPLANTTVNGNNTYVTNTTLDQTYVYFLNTTLDKNNEFLANTTVDGDKIYMTPISKEFNDTRQTLSLVLHIVIFIFGLILNGTLIIIFALEKEVRTSQNIMIFNITATDIISLTRISIPFMPPGRSTRIMIWLSLFPLHVQELSVICLSAERYSAISRTLPNSSSYRISTRTRNIIYVIGVWGAVLGVMTIVWVSVSYDDRRTKTCLFLIDLLVQLLGVPICVTVFNVLTSRLLKQCAQDVPGEGSQEALVHSRYRSSRVVISMAIAYIVSNVPGLIFFAIHLLAPVLKIDLKTWTIFCIYIISYFLYFSKSIINPIALYIGSKKFRHFFNKYLFRCVYKKDIAQTETQKIESLHVSTKL
jgi:hypothetical protein